MNTYYTRIKELIKIHIITLSKILSRFIDTEGAQDFSLNSSGIASVALSGSALATFTGNAGCSDHGYYATITENIFNQDEWDGVVSIAVANGNIELGSGELETLKVYKLFNNGTQPALIDNTKLTFTGSMGITITTSGTVSATQSGTIEIVATDRPNLTTGAVVTFE